jgi:hypothetical protein
VLKGNPPVARSQYSLVVLFLFSFLSLQKRREETGGILSTGNVWQRRQDTL